MSVGAEHEIDWEELEKQFDGGGFDGGRDDNDGWYGGNSDDDEDPDDGRVSAASIAGGLIGAVPGICAGAYADKKYQEHAINSYISRHHIMTTPSSRPMIEDQVFLNAVDAKTDIGIITAPIIALTALGVVVARRLESRFRR